MSVVAGRLQNYVERETKSIKKKMEMINARIKARDEKNSKKFPGKNVLALETFEDACSLAYLEGQISSIKKLYKSL